MPMCNDNVQTTTNKTEKRMESEIVKYSENLIIPKVTNLDNSDETKMEKLDNDRSLRFDSFSVDAHSLSKGTNRNDGPICLGD